MAGSRTPGSCADAHCEEDRHEHAQRRELDEHRNVLELAPAFQGIRGCRGCRGCAGHDAEGRHRSPPLRVGQREHGGCNQQRGRCGEEGPPPTEEHGHGSDAGGGVAVSIEDVHQHLPVEGACEDDKHQRPHGRDAGEDAPAADDRCARADAHCDDCGAHQVLHARKGLEDAAVQEGCERVEVDAQPQARRAHEEDEGKMARVHALQRGLDSGRLQRLAHERSVGVRVVRVDVESMVPVVVYHHRGGGSEQDEHSDERELRTRARRFEEAAESVRAADPDRDEPRCHGQVVRSCHAEELACRTQPAARRGLRHQG
mmetsp:Transcript_10292/g.26768  ORF Transcript_10292/g.26768 Transcript_10292/m.26768 type:complete len:315 (+) Transcript_10292:289-1233(+)